MKGFNQLNKAFESRVRLGVMSILMVKDWVNYNELKDTLGLTDGNLASHIASLEKMEYVEIQKQFVGKKPMTTYRVTNLGKMEFTKHIDALEALLKR
jgi:DNA-binding MarR family transcriptional regulator